MAMTAGRRLTALTVGGAMVDTIAIIDDELIERISLSNSGKTFLLLEQGSKTEAADISTHCGGGAVNAAVSLARIGFEVSVLAKVGEDERARLVRATLTSEGISTLGLRTTSLLATGASAIISAHDRNAAVFTFRGANTALREQDIDAQAFGASLVYVSSLSGESAAMLPYILDAALQRGDFVAVNPGIKQITTRFSTLRNNLARIGLLALNRLEAEAFVRQAIAELSGSENAHLRQMAAGSLHRALEAGIASRADQARALIEGLTSLGAQGVLLTDGRHGGYFGTPDAVVFCPALEVPVSSTVGAGDAFVSTFCALRVLGHDIEECMRGATANSAAVVMKSDTQSGLLHKAELLRLIEQNSKELSVKSWPI